jgi:hypothetical protein
MAPRPPRAILVLGRLWIPLIVLAATATTAVACLSPKPTSLSTSLTGGGKEGAEITVSEGTGVKDTATLSGENAGKATGTVKYAVYSDSKCEKLVTKAGEVTVKEGKVPASEEKELEAGAVYYWQAEYGGDSIDEASKSPCGKEVLTVKAKTSLSTSLVGGGKEGTEITVNEGTGVKDTATLSGTNATKATGTVEYLVYSDKECKELASKAGEGAVSGGKAAGSSEEKLEGGTVYYWKAVYGGDSLHEASTSPCTKEVLTVKAATTLTTSLSDESESGESLTVLEGARVKDTATLSGTKASTATGAVDYAAYKDNECKELASKAGEGKVEGTKVESSEEEELEAGEEYYWQAEYLGDSLHQGSKSTCGEVVDTVNAPAKFTTPSNEDIIILGNQLISARFSMDGTQAVCGKTWIRDAPLQPSPIIDPIFTPNFSECTAFTFTNASVTVPQCPITLRAGAETNPGEFNGEAVLECSGENAGIVIVGGTCEVRITGKQGFNSGITFENDSTASPQNVKLYLVLTGVVVNKVKDGLSCPLNGTGQTTATITAAWILVAYNDFPEEEQVSLAVKP